MKMMKEDAKCCVFFLRVISFDLSRNNILYSLLTSHSVFTPKVLRLSMLYLHFLLELALCALFFDMENPDGDLSLSAADFLESFWVGIYSILLSLVPMFLLGLTMRTGSRIKD